MLYRRSPVFPDAVEVFGAISSTLAGNYSWPGSLAGIRIGLDLLAKVSALIVSSGRSANRFPAAGNGPRLAPSPGATSGSISGRLAPASLGQSRGQNLRKKS